MIRIFVEGKDAQFIDKYLLFLLGQNEGIWEIINAGGYTKLDLLDQQFKENSERGGLNLIIFDADNESNGGGFELRRKCLENEIKKISVSADLFLFPNNKEDGDFELLLEHIANEEHTCLLECFEGYEKCVSGHKDENGNCKYITPNRKAKIYAYVESIKKTNRETKRFKDKDFFFDNPIYWNLNADYLLPLKDFLLKAYKTHSEKEEKTIA